MWYCETASSFGINVILSVITIFFSLGVMYLYLTVYLHRASWIPKVVGSIPTLVRHIFQLSRATLQISFPELICKLDSRSPCRVM